MPQALPVHILGGYLGAGKTTILNAILSADQGLRSGVLVNDFGAINIDAALIADRDAEVVALTNGCACCTIANDLGQALVKIQSPRLGVEQVIIEASGVADPWKLAEMAMTWPGFALGTISTVIDITDIQRLCRDRYVGRIVQRQLQVADFLLPAKLDLCEATSGHEVMHWLEDAYPRATLLRTGVKQDYARLLGEPPPTAGSHRRSRGPILDHSTLFHSNAFSDLQVVSPQSGFRLLGALAPEVVRAKGLIEVNDEESPWRELQLAGKRGTLQAARGATRRAISSGLVFCWVGNRDQGAPIKHLLEQFGFLSNH